MGGKNSKHRSKQPLSIACDSPGLVAYSLAILSMKKCHIVTFHYFLYKAAYQPCIETQGHTDVYKCRQVAFFHTALPINVEMWTWHIENHCFLCALAEICKFLLQKNAALCTPVNLRKNCRHIYSQAALVMWSPLWQPMPAAGQKRWALTIDGNVWEYVVTHSL